MLVRREALEAAGGIAAIRGALIDDCTLGALLEAGAGLAGADRRSRSIRPYDGFEPIAAMISRSAYAQLHYSPVLLAGTLPGWRWSMACRRRWRCSGMACRADWVWRPGD
jgi:hypothetical protein